MNCLAHKVHQASHLRQRQAHLLLSYCGKQKLAYVSVRNNFRPLRPKMKTSTTKCVSRLEFIKHYEPRVGEDTQSNRFFERAPQVSTICGADCKKLHVPFCIPPTNRTRTGLEG